MNGNKFIRVISNGTEIVLSNSEIIYIMKTGNNVEIHALNGRQYITRMTIAELEERLGAEFIKVHRGCIVSAMAIHNITDKINLNNGESLEYTIRKKKLIIEQFCRIHKKVIYGFSGEGIPQTDEEYKEYYKSFEKLPFAFTDIEMIFDENKKAIDWIFRYGNEELAKLEKIPLERMLGKSFGSLFLNMDSKWLRCYERAVLYGEKLEITDYSPEIDEYLKIVCFPTFNGHCGCILFNITGVEHTNNGSERVFTLSCD